MNWADEPATEQQLRFLSHLGQVVERPLTRSEAVQLIRRLQERTAGGLAATLLEVDESTRQEAFRLRRNVESARCALAAAYEAEGEEREHEVQTTLVDRQEFWLDTCREANQMHHASVEVLDLYRNHGCRFFAPSHEQVQEVLDALDSALANWDREHPELFYQTLQLNFPELVRH